MLIPVFTQILYVIYGVFNVALVALWASPATTSTKTSVPSAVMTLIGSLALGLLSFVEHQKTIRPSLIIESYLGSSLVFDAVRVRTLWMQGYNDTVAAVFTVSFAAKAILLCVEALGKRRVLRAEYKGESAEAKSGLLAKLTFWWLNPLFLTGYSRSLSMTDMLPLDKHLTTAYLYRRMNKAWSHAAGKKSSLLVVYLGRLKWHLRLSPSSRSHWLQFLSTVFDLQSYLLLSTAKERQHSQCRVRIDRGLLPCILWYSIHNGPISAFDLSCNNNGKRRPHIDAVRQVIFLRGKQSRLGFLANTDERRH